MLYLGDYCCNVRSALQSSSVLMSDQPESTALFCCICIQGTFEQDEEPGYHLVGKNPEYTVYATAKSEANTIRASPHSGVRDLGLDNLVIGRDPKGALSVGTLSAHTIQAQKLVVPTQLKNSCAQYLLYFLHSPGLAQQWNSEARSN